MREGKCSERRAELVAFKKKINRKSQDNKKKPKTRQQKLRHGVTHTHGRAREPSDERQAGWERERERGDETPGIFPSLESTVWSSGALLQDWPHGRCRLRAVTCGFERQRRAAASTLCVVRCYET